MEISSKLSYKNNREEEAFKYYLQGAEEGHIEAFYPVAEYYFKRKNAEQAAYYYRLATSQRAEFYELACYKLAQLYCSGYGITQSFERAIYYFKMAGDFNDALKKVKELQEISLREEIQIIKNTMISKKILYPDAKPLENSDKIDLEYLREDPTYLSKLQQYLDKYLNEKPFYLSFNINLLEEEIDIFRDNMIRHNQFTLSYLSQDAHLLVASFKKAGYNPEKNLRSYHFKLRGIAFCASIFTNDTSFKPFI